MNPFTESTVAVPLTSELTSTRRLTPLERSRGHWSFPFAYRARDRLARRAGVAAMLAGVGFSAHALDLNAASVEQLKDLRGVGPRTAQIIVQERNRAGRFASLEDLSDRVRGIGPKRIQALYEAGLRVVESGARQEIVSTVGQTAQARAAHVRSTAPTGSATPVIQPEPVPEATH